MFDLRPHFPELPDQSQIAQGGANAIDNCEPTSFTYCLEALGYGHPLSPEAIMEGANGSNWRGGVGDGGPGRVLSYIQSRSDVFPNLPPIDIITTDGPGFIAQADAAGRQGYPMIGAFWCSTLARILPANDPAVVASHASCPVAFDGTNWTVWNVWTGFEEVKSTAELTQAFVPGPWLVIFRKSVFPAPPEGASMSTLIVTPNNELHSFDVGSDGHLVHGWSGTPDASLDLINQANKEDLPLPAGADQNSFAVAILGDSFTLKINAPYTTNTVTSPLPYYRVQNWSTGAVGRDWTPAKGPIVQLGNLQGPAGDSGPVGPKGDAGPPGPPGKDGSSVTTPTGDPAQAASWWQRFMRALFGG